MTFHVLPLVSNPSHTLQRYDMKKREKHCIFSPACVPSCVALKTVKLETSWKNTSSSYRPHHLQTIVSIRECYSWNPASDEGQETWSNSLNMLILAIALIRLYCRLMANCLLLLLFHGFSCNVECWANANQKKCSKHSVGNVESIGYLSQLLWIWYLAT